MVLAGEISNPGLQVSVACERKSSRMRLRPRLKDQNQAGTLGVC